jgi:anti-sigma factor RsiW
MFPNMNCCTFRENHAAYVDDALAEGERADMHAHLAECSECAAHDTSVRRALLLFRNMPTIQPSPDFSAKLNERLRAAGYGHGKGQPSSRLGGISGVASAAAGFVAAGYLAVAVFGTLGPVRADLALAPVVATAIEPAPPPINIYAPQSPEIVASVSAGLPVWPAAMLAAQAPLHFTAASLNAQTSR